SMVGARSYDPPRCGNEPGDHSTRFRFGRWSCSNAKATTRRPWPWPTSWRGGYGPSTTTVPHSTPPTSATNPKPPEGERKLPGVRPDLDPDEGFGTRVGQAHNNSGSRSRLNDRPPPADFMMAREHPAHPKAQYTTAPVPLPKVRDQSVRCLQGESIHELLGVLRHATVIDLARCNE